MVCGEGECPRRYLTFNVCMEKALPFAYFYLKFRARTVHEMRLYLRKKMERFQYSEDDIEAAITYLKENKYLNDAEFVRSYVDQRLRGKPRGESVLKMELRRKGISQDIITEFFSETPMDTEALAYEALSRKWRSYERFAPEIRYRRAVNFLSRRGFPYETIKKTIARKTAER